MNYYRRPHQQEYQVVPSTIRVLLLNAPVHTNRLKIRTVRHHQENHSQYHSVDNIRRIAEILQ